MNFNKNLKKLALVLSIVTAMDGVSTPLLTYAAEPEAIELEMAEHEAAELEVMEENTALAEEGEIYLQEGETTENTDSAVETEEVTEVPVQEEPEPVYEPIISTVPVNPEADVKLLKTDKAYKLLYGASGIIDVDTSSNKASQVNFDFISGRILRSENEDVLQLTETPTGYVYTALSAGEAYITMEYSRSDKTKNFTKTYHFYVAPDMTAVTAAESSFEAYYDASAYKWDSSWQEADFALTGVPEGQSISDYNSIIDYSVSGSSNVKIQSVSVYDNTVSISATGRGKKTVKVEINGKKFSFVLKLNAVKMNKTSALIMLGKTLQLKVSGYDGKIKWSSDRKSIVTVSSKGVVKAKGCGSATITAVAGDFKLYAVINTASRNKYNAISTAKSIVRSSKYSQPLRMRKGYYDCSSLVWRSFKNYGYYFGNRYWAPVAAEICRYLMVRHKKVAVITDKKIQAKKFNPGDLYFGTGANNGRYLGIYHVEICTGYDMAYVDGKGKPHYTMTWVNRTNGYGLGGLVCRP